MTEQTDNAGQFQMYGPALLQWAVMQMPPWLGAKLDPEDLVQQTLLEAVKAADRLAGCSEKEVLAYLRRALLNNLIDSARKYAKNRGEIAPESLAESSMRMAEWLAASDTSPSERFSNKEKAARLAEGVARLPEAQRLAVELRYMKGQKVADIAKSLGKTEGAVAALLHRAVTTLKVDLHHLDN